MQPGARTDARKPYASHPFGRRTAPARSLHTRKPHASRPPFPRCRRRPLKTDGSHPLSEPSVFFMRGESRGHGAYPKHRLPFLIFDCI